MYSERLWKHPKKDIQVFWIFNLLSSAIFLQFRRGISNIHHCVWWQCFQKQTANSLERIDADCISRANVNFWEYIWIMREEKEKRYPKIFAKKIFFQLFSFNFLWYWQHCFGILIHEDNNQIYRIDDSFYLPNQLSRHLWR